MQIPFDGYFTLEDAQAHFRRLGGDVFFVQVGAMDGRSFDPIHGLVNELGWRGILVEPIPAMFERLKNNYAPMADRLAFINAAIADYDGEIEMTTLDPAVVDKKLLPDTVLGISTMMPDRGILGAHNTDAHVAEMFATYKRTLKVPCYRLQTLIERQHIEKIDLFVCDTEGADWMVTQQLPLERFRPRIVYLEYHHLSGAEQIACAEHFRNHGYSIYIDKNGGENFLAVLR